MVVLPDTLFARSTRSEDRPEQDKDIISLWVDPHQLKKIDSVWQKDGRTVVTAKSPYQNSSFTISTTYLYMVTQESVRLQTWSRGSTGGHNFGRM